MKSGLEKLVEWWDGLSDMDKALSENNFENKARSLLSEEQENRTVVNEEPLEELAAKKGIGYEVYCHLGKYHIQMFGSELRTQEIFKAFEGIELGAIKSLARAYLNGLPDKGETK